jgi:hypothetical protein
VDIVDFFVSVKIANRNYTEIYLKERYDELLRLALPEQRQGLILGSLLSPKEVTG